MATSTLMLQATRPRASRARRGGGDTAEAGDVFERAAKESVYWGFFDSVLRRDKVL
ncbi:hypothetical protein D8674_022025 [Pyrus ussuriensis x Pyrus communis]|uniref:Uncharacterized protein n=1 Tax=Pyrus ussuriensis x Pyrus communis TaxID=2448454 RepID=A0A5N5GJZ1_9ROSA|nr:hypothetical protein D8674_022025 [Pyrus ussuriensis x Pyrus communis]